MYTERNKKDSVFKIIYTLRGGDGNEYEYELALSGGKMAITQLGKKEVSLDIDFHSLAVLSYMNGLSWVNEDGSTTNCLLPLEFLMEELKQMDETAIRVINLPSGRQFIYLLCDEIFIDELTGNKVKVMPKGLYMDSPLRVENV